MRCYCCNRNLSDYESTLRSALSGEYLDTCTKCLQDLDINVLKSDKEMSNHSPDEMEEEDDFGNF